MMNSYMRLKTKIEKKKATLCIVGLGYVGLPVATAFAQKGYRVYGFDTSTSRIKKLSAGIEYIVDVPPEATLPLIKKKRFIPTTNAKVITDSDIIIICVPTPLRKVKVPDVSYIISASRTIQKYLRKGQLIVLESTSYPTTTREVVLPVLKKSGLREEKDFFLCFSPERVNPGDKKFPFVKIPKVVGGLSLQSGRLAKLLYSKIIKKVHMVSCPEAAETSKLLENTFRLVNIALANEFALVCNKLNINIWEVIEAAKTKPFGFMPFYPGPGIGGHCLEGNEVLLVKDASGSISLKSFQELFDEKKESGALSHLIRGVDYVKPHKTHVLSFDLKRQNAVFKPLMLLSKRPVSKNILKITTNDNRKITLSDMHPLIVKENGAFQIKWAKDMCVGEEIPCITALPASSGSGEKIIDLIPELAKSSFAARIRVKPLTFKWRTFKEEIRKLSIRSEVLSDFLKGNYLPLRFVLELERKKLLSMSHRNLLLCCGRGPSYTEFPAVITLDADLWRMVGYYLSEGCITKDKSSRVRFSFHRDEQECIEDLLGILRRRKVKYSLFRSRMDKTLHIKVSSNIFAFLLKDILCCGHNSYTMRIPNIIFSQSAEHKNELLKGMFRGDGGVDLSLSKRRYIKNGKEYICQSKTANVNYYSASRILFHQLIYLLQSDGIIPCFKKRDNLLQIVGNSQLTRFSDVFLDGKKKKLEKFFNAHRKNIPNRSFTQYGSFITSRVKKIEKARDKYVYSAEVKGTNTFVTSYGMVVHNCIPCDPIYLSWKAKRIGFKTKIIDLASYVNHYMPRYVVSRVSQILKKRKRKLKGSRVLILGVAYKKDVKDLRESPSLDIIEEFQKKKARVGYYDPLFPYLKILTLNLKRTPLSKKTLKKYDCIVVVTNHSRVRYDFIQKNAKCILDTRNVYKKSFSNVERL